MSAHAHTAYRRGAEVARPDLQQVLITDRMSERPARVPDHAAENLALRALAGELANPKGDILKQLCELAMQLCHAHSAGISLVEFEGDEKVFRWHAVAGRWAGYVGGCLPRNASPCGVVIDLNATQLMKRPAQAFPLVALAEPELVEALLAPFLILGEPVGTVWVLSHDDTRKFDSEDARIVESLASFAAAAFTLRNWLGRATELNDELKRSNARLNRLVERGTT
jgi:GAF domain-containing protein